VFVVGEVGVTECWVVAEACECSPVVGEGGDGCFGDEDSVEECLCAGVDDVVVLAGWETGGFFDEVLNPLGGAVSVIAPY
jgi:hypothetical protein